MTAHPLICQECHGCRWIVMQEPGDYRLWCAKCFSEQSVSEFYASPIRKADLSHEESVVVLSDKATALEG